MQFRKVAIGVTAAAMLAGSAQAAEQFIPVAAYWTGPYAAGGSAFGDGMADYYEFLNIRDGGINGVKLTYEKCETAYKTDRIVECYEKMKNNGPTGSPFYHPFSTGGTYAVFERAEADKVPIITIGYGRTDASDGRVFPYLFPALTNYWSQSTAKIKFIGSLEGGMEKLKGLKIANVHHDSAYGKETIPVLEEQAKKYGFEFRNFPVAHPGLDQKAIWLQIARQYRPDYVILRGWGVMNPTSLKEAARVRFPANKIVGVWWSGSEEDTRPAGDAAEGYYAAGYHGAGTDYPVIQWMMEHLYSKGKGSVDQDRLGTIYVNRAFAMAMVGTEAIRDAMKMVGENRPVTGPEVQAALEQLTFDKARLEKLGAVGLLPEFAMTCEDHEGGAPVRFLQWNNGAWTSASDWIETDQSIVRPMVEKSAAAYAAEKGITPRDCGA
ncbi:MAG: ABC transporter permease [Rhizobiales bacterium NRL2]|jgi:branched-chain amino acid transport system substrate-binding protein|nr:MAG: ABC transporter permease [Rhizobiales bacterium NRL2]